MAVKQAAVKVSRWSGSKHPTLSNITRMMREEGLRPYKWDTRPNQRYAVRSHGYTKILFLVEGKMEITLPDSNQRMKLRSGDRVEIPAGVRHGSVTGGKGATCLEAAVRQRR
jgi:quercetin dioxygenase-like cupin family protein